MTRPYDVENDIRKITQARVDADELTRAIANLGDSIADAFRSRFDMDMDMEDTGATLVIAAAMLCPIANRGDTSPTILVDTLAMAGENLVRTARVRTAEHTDEIAEIDARLRAVLAEPTWLARLILAATGSWDPHGDVEAQAAAAEQAVRLLQPEPAGREVEGVLCEHVLTWHPVDATVPPVELPLYAHITLPDGIGELRSHTREVASPSPSGLLPAWEDESDRAYQKLVELGGPSPEVSDG